MSRTRLVVVGPVPPPRHGVTISTALVLANPFLRDRFDVVHLDTSDRRPQQNIGTWDFRNVVLGASATLRLVRQLRGPHLSTYA